MDGLEYGVIDEAGVDEVAAIMRWSFGGGEDFAPRYVRETVGVDSVRVLRDGARAVAALALVPMGMWLGGRRLPLAAVAAVATAPEARGRGVSQALLAASLRELRAGGTALASLYPASLVLYRRNGFEIAGMNARHRARASAIDARDRALAVRPIGPEDMPAVMALHQELARGQDGNLDRGEAGWRPILRRRGVAATGLGVFDGGALVGYCWLRQAPASGHAPYDLEVADLAATTDAAWRRLLTLLRDHGSLGAEVRWGGPLADPVTLLLREEVHQVEEIRRWMLRLVDVGAALAGRGYFRGVTASVVIEVEDPVLPENAGRYRLEVAGGEAEVTRDDAGSGPVVRCPVGSLAAIFTGYAKASELARVGKVGGDPGAIALLDAIFHGPIPWHPDNY